jgi:DNA-directed RNA polymerase specialized sigma54-like protein
MNLSDHLSRLKTTVDTCLRLPHVFQDLANLPPGSNDEAEAQELLDTFKAMNIHQDGTALDPTGVPAESFQTSLESGAQASKDAFQQMAYALLTRLDHLARRGIRPPGCVLATDFEEIIFLTNADNPEGPRTAAGAYDSLDRQNPLVSRISREDCYQMNGKALIILGKARTGIDGPKPLPWLPAEECIKHTLSLSHPQKIARKAHQDQEEAERERRRQQWEDSKSPHVKRLEAQVAELQEQNSKLRNLATVVV